MRYANTKRAKAQGRWITYTMSAWFKDGTKSYWKASFLGDTQMRESFISRLEEEFIQGEFDKHLITLNGQVVNDEYFWNHQDKHYGEKIVPAYKIRVNSIDGEKVNKSFIKN
jgi:hypothetical protein